MLPVETPFKTYTGIDGKPLHNGYIHFGVANSNPITSPVTVYWDAAGTQPAAQPLRTENGYIMRAGTPANVFLNASYSELIRDSKGRQVAFARNSADFSIGSFVQTVVAEYASSLGASKIGFPSSPGRTVQQQLDMLYFGIASVLDPQFAGGADPAGVADSTAAVQAAFNASKYVSFPPTSAHIKISNTITYKSEHIVEGSGIGVTRIVMTDPTKWAFACDPVVSTYFNNGESAGGGFFDLDLRARYGIRMGTPNLANAPTYNYADAGAFFAANSPVQQFKVERCNLISDIDYAGAYNYIAASPNWNTLVIPTNSDLYTRGCGVFFANNYRGAVRDCQIKFYGIAVYLFGSDLADVSNCRIANNLRHIMIQFQHASGAQCEINHNDLLANYRYGGVFCSTAHNSIADNYFENTGGPTNSTIASYIVDMAQTTSITENRFDDYGSTKLAGPLITFGGVGGAHCAMNKVADNRPGGAGLRAPLEIITTNWDPSFLALSNQTGLVSMGLNDSSFPRISHPLVSYDLDGANALYWSPCRKSRDLSFRDISSGGLANAFKCAKDANGLWFFNSSPFSNAINLKPAQHQLTKGLSYTVKIRARCTLAIAPFNVFWVVSWISAAGVKTDLFTNNKTHATNTTVEEFSQVVAIPALTEGYFSVGIDPTGGNLYSIEITEV